MQIANEIQKFREFFEQDQDYLAKINAKALDPEEKHIVVDFRRIIEFEPSLGHLILAEPGETLKAMEAACLSINECLSDSFKVRLKNVSKLSEVPIGDIITKHIGRFITVSGTVKQRSEVKGRLIYINFMCESCGKNYMIFQPDEDRITAPSKCICGRKSLRQDNATSILENRFVLMLEEPMELSNGGSNLSRVRVVCRDGLAEPMFSKKIIQGARLTITGELVSVQITKRGKKTPDIDWYIDANYIEFKEGAFDELVWTPEEEVEIKELARSKNWLRTLRDSIFYDVKGYDEECESVILQMLGGIEKTRESKDVRGTIHLLLVGDPGTCKSTIVKIANKFALKSRYVVATGASGVGLIGAVVKDELTGTYGFEAGELLLSNGGICAIDELDKMNPEELVRLNSAMSEQEISIAKSTIHLDLPCKTGILAAANPKLSLFSQYEPIRGQINMPESVFNRFDLVYPIYDNKTEYENDMEIGCKILSRGQGNDIREFPKGIKRPYTRHELMTKLKKEGVDVLAKEKLEELQDKCIKKGIPIYQYSCEFIKKYFYYTKQHVTERPQEIQEYLAHLYAELRQKRYEAIKAGKAPIYVSPRHVDSMGRLADAIARGQLHKHVTKADAKLATDKIHAMLKRLGLDATETQGVEIMDFDGKKVAINKSDIQAQILHLLREKKEPMEAGELYAIMEERGFSREAIDHAIERLSRIADIIEPRRGYFTNVT